MLTEYPASISQLYEEGTSINECALQAAMIEIKLHVNRKLYEKGVLTEEMFTRAKEMILRT